MATTYAHLTGAEAEASEAANRAGYDSANYADAYGGSDTPSDERVAHLATYYGVDESFIRSAWSDGIDDYAKENGSD